MSEQIGCEFCGDVTAAMFLHARCHPTAPLMARKEGDVLILSCYLPECAREVVRFHILEEEQALAEARRALDEAKAER